MVPVSGAYCMVVSESGWAELSSLRVVRFVTSDCRSSCRVVETGASPRRYGVLRPPSIHAHSSDRGSAVRAPQTTEKSISDFK